MIDLSLKRNPAQPNNTDTTELTDTYAEFDAPEGKSKHDSFLKSIEGIESSFGKNTTHRVILSGIHAGDSAQGRFGLMPQTAIDISKKIVNKDTVLGRYTQHMKMPDIARLSRLSKANLLKAMANPTIERKLARLLVKEISLKQKGDARRMAEAWNRGSNLRYAAVSDTQLDQSAYVKKFDELNTTERLKKTTARTASLMAKN